MQFNSKAEREAHINQIVSEMEFQHRDYSKYYSLSVFEFMRIYMGGLQFIKYFLYNFPQEQLIAKDHLQKFLRFGARAAGVITERQKEYMTHIGERTGPFAEGGAYVKTLNEVRKMDFGKPYELDDKLYLWVLQKDCLDADLAYRLDVWFFYEYFASKVNYYSHVPQMSPRGRLVNQVSINLKYPLVKHDENYRNAYAHNQLKFAINDSNKDACYFGPWFLLTDPEANSYKEFIRQHAPWAEQWDPRHPEPEWYQKWESDLSDEAERRMNQAG